MLNRLFQIKVATVLWVLAVLSIATMVLIPMLESMERPPETVRIHQGAGITRIELDEVICYRNAKHNGGGLWCHQKVQP